MSKIPSVQHITSLSIYLDKQNNASTLAIDIDFFNLLVSTCCGRSMLRSVWSFIPFIYKITRKTMNKNRNHVFDFSHLSCLDLFLIQIMICLYFTTDVKHNNNSVIVDLTGLPV